jgi:hypothetical protein
MLAAGVAATAPGARAAGEIAPPLPPPRPGDTAPTPAETDAGSDKGGSASAPGAAQESEACPARLTRLGVRFEPRPSIESAPCGGTDIVVLSELPGGVTVAPASTMRCPVAEALAHWSVEVVSAQADQHLKAAPTKMLIGTSYECRDQRNGAKLSEHAFANAVDVMGFEFAKRAPHKVEFQAPDSPEAAFQDAVRAGACPLFTTVLGPGSDPAHSNHLHLDLRSRTAGYRICQ